MRLTTLIAAGIAAACLVGAAHAQGFPTLTFDQLGAVNERLAAAEHRTPRPGDLMFNPGENGGGKTRAVFTGQSRALDPRKSAFITAFASSSIGNDRYAALYQKEYLFKAGGRDYWLPVQIQVAAYFGRELKTGEPVNLYIRNAGGFRGSTAWDWMFLVEEFDTPGTAPKDAPKAPGKPPGKSGPAIPPGPKTSI